MSLTKKLSILTTTKNCQSDIEKLIVSLNEQIDQNFNWVIIDGGSTDKTIELIKLNCKVNHKIISSNDFSIYHAMNIGVANIETEYYCTAGSDDSFELDFVSNINLYLRGNFYDLILGCVKMGNGSTCVPGTGKGWLKGMHGVGSSHSIGTVINRNLHKKFDLYSKMYPVVADQHFIKKCIYGGAKVLRVDACFGTYAIDGFSSANKLQYQLDFFKMQLETEKYWFLQLTLFTIRFVKLKIIKLTSC